MKQKKLPKETRSFLVIKYSEKGKEKQNIEVVAESPFQILINDDNIASIMLTPTNLGDFLTGFLIGQGIIENSKQIKKMLIEPEKGLLWAQVKEPVRLNLAKSFITSGCGGGISLLEAGSLARVRKAESQETHRINPPKISFLMKEMLASGHIYRKSGGVHSACLASLNKGIIFQVEDIGRHNCIDKVIGYLVNNKINPKDKIILTTGRISLEAVPKVARAKVTVLGSRSTSTDLAIDLAKKLNIRLLGYIRSKKVTLYS